LSNKDFTAFRNLGFTMSKILHIFPYEIKILRIWVREQTNPQSSLLFLSIEGPLRNMTPKQKTQLDRHLRRFLKADIWSASPTINLVYSAQTGHATVYRIQINTIETKIMSLANTERTRLWNELKLKTS